jgi:uncharacterized protein YycO
VLGTDFSHAMLYLGNDDIVESTTIGVSSKKLSTILPDISLAVVLRRRNMTDSLREQVVTTAKGFIGKDYDFLGAIGSGAEKPRGNLLMRGLKLSPAGRLAVYIAQLNYKKNAEGGKKDSDFFCSELVARAFELIGKPLYEGVDPSFTNPREIRTCSKLLYVGHLKA